MSLESYRIAGTCEHFFYRRRCTPSQLRSWRISPIRKIVIRHLSSTKRGRSFS